MGRRGGTLAKFSNQTNEHRQDFERKENTGGGVSRVLVRGVSKTACTHIGKPGTEGPLDRGPGILKSQGGRFPERRVS